MRQIASWIGICLLATLCPLTVGAQTPADSIPFPEAVPSADGLIVERSNCSTGLADPSATVPFLVPLGDLGIPAGSTSLILRLVKDGSEVLRETYTLSPFTPAPNAALEGWLGGINSFDHLAWNPGDDLGVFGLEVIHDGDLLATLRLDEVMAAQDRLVGDGYRAVIARAFDVEMPAEPTNDPDEIAQLLAKATYQCPNAHPLCDQIEAACENRCYDAGPNVSQACLERCADDYYDCVYGTPTQRTVTTISNKRFAAVVCGKYRCGPRRQHDEWTYRERVRRYNGVYCQTTNRVENERLTSDTSSNRDCFKRLPPAFTCLGYEPFVGCIWPADLCPF